MQRGWLRVMVRYPLVVLAEATCPTQAVVRADARPSGRENGRYGIDQGKCVKCDACREADLTLGSLSIRRGSSVHFVDAQIGPCYNRRCSNNGREY